MKYMQHIFILWIFLIFGSQAKRTNPSKAPPIRSRLGTLYDIRNSEIFFLERDARDLFTEKFKNKFLKKVHQEYIPIAPWKYAVHFFESKSLGGILAISVDLIYFPYIETTRTILKEVVSRPMLLIFWGLSSVTSRLISP